MHFVHHQTKRLLRGLQCNLRGLVAGFLLVALSSLQAERKPNVILIYTDDQGSIDLNCYGATDLQTPHLDGLAARGVRFTQFYAAAPVCSPSRAAVLTGRFPQRAGVPGNVGSQKGRAGMPTEQITMAEMFKQAGYRTAHIGKWHLGYTPETMPNGQGFDHSFGHMGGCIDNWSHFFYWDGPNRHDLWRNGKEIWNDGRFFPDLMIEESEAFIEANRNHPFYIYWAINVPHYPLQGTDKWRKVYEDLPEPRKMYAAFVSTMDEIIGQLFALLEKANLTEDTIIVFQSDHGHSTEVRTFGGGGSAGSYRGAKFSLFEGGIRVPAIISWPGTLPQNEVRGQFATSVDWFPTVAELCGLEPPGHRIDGKSLLSIIQSARAPDRHQTFFWETGGRRTPQWAVRSGAWKLLGNPRDTSNQGELTDADNLFLANLAFDHRERSNLAAKYPAKVEELKRLYEEWKRTASDQ